jgi:hypothetical protein
MGAEQRAENLFIRYSGVLLKTASNGQFFTDITDFHDLGTIRAKSAEREVAPLLKALEKSNIKTHFEYFTSFHNRYYEWEYGTQSSKWLLDLVNDMGKETNAN